MADIHVVAENLRGFARFMWTYPANDLAVTIKNQAVNEGCNLGGFTGLMSPLTGPVQALAGKITELANVARDRVNDVGDALIVTADDYEHVEADNKEKLDSTARERGTS